MNALAAKPAAPATTPGRQVRRAHMRLTRALRNAIARHGISVGQFQLLRALNHLLVRFLGEWTGETRGTSARPRCGCSPTK
jgi:hypothetical protein